MICNDCGEDRPVYKTTTNYESRDWNRTGKDRWIETDECLDREEWKETGENEYCEMCWFKKDTIEPMQEEIEDLQKKVESLLKLNS